MGTTTITHKVVEGVNLSWLVPGSEMGFDLYRKKPQQGFVLYKTQGDQMGEWDRRRLASAGVEKLYIDVKDRQNLDRYLSVNARVYIKKSGFDIQQRCSFLHESASRIMRSFMSFWEEAEYLQMAVEIAESTVELVLSDPRGFCALVDCSDTTYRAHTHGIDVMYYTIGLGQSIGLKPERLKKIAVGALLHDIGKSRIPRDILDKQAKLSDEEFALIQKHPTSGAEILQSHGYREGEAIDAVLHHHERLDGTGYSHGLKDQEISLAAKIVFMADVFAALSTNRSYQNARNSFEAIQVMRNEMSGQFDARLLKPFILLMGRGGS